MTLVSLAIGSICSSFSSVNTTACSKALEATSKQTQVYQMDQNTEQYAMKYGQNIAYTVLGKESIDIGGSMVYAYRVYRAKAVDLKLPTLGVCNSVSSHVGIDGNYSLNFKWMIP